MNTGLLKGASRRVTDYDCYRQFLGQWLRSKNTNNRNFSLRSMARFLEIAPSLLGDVLKAKRNISAETASRVGIKLGLDPRDQEYLCLLVERDLIKDDRIRHRLEDRMQVLRKMRSLERHRADRTLELRRPQALEHWYLPAIRELLRERDETGKPKFTPSEIASRLKITESEVRAGVDRLRELGLVAAPLGLRPDYPIDPATQTMSASTLKSRGSLRAFQKQVLERGLDAIETLDPSRRAMVTETLRLEASQLPEARAILEECLGKLLLLSGSGQGARPPSEVFVVALQVFGVTGGNAVAESPRSAATPSMPPAPPLRRKAG